MYGTIYEFETLPTSGEHDGRRKSASLARSAQRGRAVPLVGIIRNPRSHRNKGHAPEMADCSNILTETPRTRTDLYGVLESFARRGIDYLVVDGGDGTVRDVLTCGADIFGEEWPTFIVLPKGKTNALAIDLGLPNQWSLAEALAAAHKGNKLTRRPLRISSRDDSNGCIQGFILGTGAFALATEAGQEAHRRGAFNSFAVGLTVLWGIIQTLFGRAGNPWRSCTPTRLVNRHTGRDLPYQGPGRSDERFMAVATTFERFPLGARPFGSDVAPGMKLGVIDWPVRWVIALLPAVLFGFWGKFLERRGVHRFCASAVDLELDGSFILDGEAFPGGDYVLEEGPQLTFVVP
ncbi:diacylglycerol/lipid kinase family protein [Novosphingobium aerophilum]|uniref:diacylglycerol/lipid kinase family protein n=1 Tax=Novosphingobium TaxID=165696 RepID=UPI0006C897B5|nr:diacylglycerol kinase family protein [Novosphingobium sp. ST904]KPH59251.1 diacylglycerol kinase [Novosphingobium sp. ST904]MPS71154.1 diacylglycerol kinase [Novosphingobium sp.]TCM37645.1 diacylglycerol kinase family enzyme [Novosphingobium sp. ST904]